MRKFLAIVICKLGRMVGKWIGKGSSLPGQIALKICPDILARVRLPECVIAVSGSNGKTSTVEMIAAILRAAGKAVIYNEEGSNQTEGVATAVLDHATLFGKVKADVLLIESDERYAARTFRFFHPTQFVITNLYRDQLTRNGHPDSVFEALLPAIFPDTELILNADDPISARFGQGDAVKGREDAPEAESGGAEDHGPVRRGHTVWFGLDRCSISADAPTGAYHDGAFCPVCGGPMEYDYVHYNHIGAYRCGQCGYAKPKTDYTVTEVDLDGGVLTLAKGPKADSANGGQSDTVKIQLAFRSIYNVYNILAAFALCRERGVPAEIAAEAISNYVLKNGRMRTFRLGSRRGTLLTSKHENSIAYDTNLRYIASRGVPCTVVVIVDAVSRKYFTSETSWLWDIDFNLLDRENVRQVVLSGRYSADLAERFSYTSLPPARWHVTESISAAAEELKGVPAAGAAETAAGKEGAEAPTDGAEELFVVTCFSDRDKFLVLTEKEG